MPPKTNKKIEQQLAQQLKQDANLQLQLRLYEHPLKNNEQKISGFYFQLISSWIENITTEAYTENALTWSTQDAGTNPEKDNVTPSTPLEENTKTIPTSIWKRGVDPVIDTQEKLAVFNNDPGIYGILILPGAQEKKIPISFSYADCSSFLFDRNKIVVRSQIIGGYHFEMTLSNVKPFISKADAVPYEPLTINIDRISSFPVTEHETISDALSSLYLYGSLTIGELTRMIYALPILDEDSIDAISGHKVAINHLSYILPGLGNIQTFKEHLTSTTFTLLLFQEPLLYQRIFSPENIEQYNVLLRSSSTSSGGDRVAAKKGGGKQDSVKLMDSPVIQAADRFLIDCITTSLQASSKINVHGEGRFRLEKLLDSAPDLLLEFEKRRKEGKLSDDIVHIKEEIEVDIRLAKASKPLRWTRPQDISLATALSKLSTETEVSKPDTSPAPGALSQGMKSGTLNTTTGSVTALKKTKWVRPRFELLSESETSLVMSVELIRKLKHPNDPVSLLPPTPRHLLAAATATNATATNATTAAAATAKGAAAAGTASTTSSVRSSVTSSGVGKAIQDILAVTPFTREVFIFRYKDDDTLLALNDAVMKVNSLALPNIQGSLRSYSLTPEELQASNSGALDIISGFTIIDNDVRIVVLEGLAGPGKGMQSLFFDVPRMKPNDSDCKILSNPEILFPKRLYAEFGSDFKRIRVREPLHKLARRPELYNRKQVDADCFECIDRLMALRRALDLRSAKEHTMFPTADSLNQLELLYGEAVTRADMDGESIEEQRCLQKERERRQRAQNKRKTESATSLHTSPSKTTATGTGTRNRTSDGPSLDTITGASATSSATVRSASAPLDCTNPAFDEWLRRRREFRKDRLAEQRELTKRAWEEGFARIAKRDADTKELIEKVLGPHAAAGGKIYAYSGQKYNISELTIEAQRKKLIKAKNVIFTHSSEYMSQSVTLAEQRLAGEVRQEKLDWLTPSGFVYPAAKSYEELVTHPKRPTEARIKDLETPYDGEMRLGSSVTSDPLLAKLESQYDGTKIRGGENFGILLPPEFERPFTLSRIGDKKKLPRGNLLEETRKRDPDFEKSVHLGGLRAAAKLQEALEKEKKDWMDRVVVDNVDFKVGGFHVRDTPIQMDRTSDILHGNPNTVALKKLRAMRTTRGKDIHYETTPLTILNTGESAGNLANPRTILARKEDKTKFITTKLSFTEGNQDLNDKRVDGDPLDFIRYIPTNAHVPLSQKIVHRRKHIALDGHT